MAENYAILEVNSAVRDMLGGLTIGGRIFLEKAVPHNSDG
jgi:hypothetical protein